MKFIILAHDRWIILASEFNPYWFQPSVKFQPIREQVAPGKHAQERVSAFTKKKLARQKCRYERSRGGNVWGFCDCFILRALHDLCTP